MELPPLLRQGIDRALNGMPLDELATAAAALSQRYRDERRDGNAHVESDRDVLAYLAVRLPATYAASGASFSAIAEARPDFAPKTALDIGAGPGTALWAAVRMLAHSRRRTAGRSEPNIPRVRRATRGGDAAAARDLAHF